MDTGGGQADEDSLQFSSSSMTAAGTSCLRAADGHEHSRTAGGNNVAAGGRQKGGSYSRSSGGRKMETVTKTAAGSGSQAAEDGLEDSPTVIRQHRPWN